MSQGYLPFLNSSFSTNVDGLQLGDTFRDRQGRVLMLTALSNDLTSDTTAANQILSAASTAVTYATGLSGAIFTATQTAANVLGSGTTGIVFGVIEGAVAEATAATAAANRFVLSVHRGRTTVATNGDDDIAAGDYLTKSSGNGTCDSVAQSSTTALTYALASQVIGRAVAADVDASDTVVGYLSCRLSI